MCLILDTRFEVLWSMTKLVSTKRNRWLMNIINDQSNWVLSSNNCYSIIISDNQSLISRLLIDIID